MPEAPAEPKLLFPFLRPSYSVLVIPLSWLVVRVSVGWIFTGSRVGQDHDWPHRCLSEGL